MGRFSSSLTYTLSTVLVLLLVSFGYSALKKYRLDGSSDETAVNLESGMNVRQFLTVFDVSDDQRVFWLRAT